MYGSFRQCETKLHKLPFSTAGFHYTAAQIVNNCTPRYALKARLAPWNFLRLYTVPIAYKTLVVNPLVINTCLWNTAWGKLYTDVMRTIMLQGKSVVSFLSSLTCCLLSYNLKPCPHQQQCRWCNIVECYKSNDSFDNTTTLNVASTKSNVASTLLLVWTGLYVVQWLRMRFITVSKKYCGIKSDCIIYRGLAKYRPQHSM